MRDLSIIGAVLWNAEIASGQIVVPGRLPNGQRMPVLTTMTDLGVLTHDSIRSLSPEEGGRDTWWHRHALFADGPVQVVMDPIVDYARQWRRVGVSNGNEETASGFQNIRGVRYSGKIDNTVAFGGKVLEIQRVLVGPETEYVLATQGYPGMGPGKLRPTDHGLFGIDQSLAEVWFDAKASNRIRLQCGLGAIGMGLGTRNILWNTDMAPAPYLLVDIDIGRGWRYRWYQSRQRSDERLPSNGAREGRYAPLGVAVRSIGKSIEFGKTQWDINWIVTRWTDVLERGENRSGAADWALALAPWSVPNSGDTARPLFLAGHHGIDMQLRRPKSMWYCQARFNPWFDFRYSNLIQNGTLNRVQFLFGHVRHGLQWSVWTEFTPVSNEIPNSLDPASSGGSLGFRSRSSLQPDWLQGIEWRPAGLSISMELGHLTEDWSWKTTLAIPSITADAGAKTRRIRRKSLWPNRGLPPLIPLSPFISMCRLLTQGDMWWSVGISSPVTNSRKTY
ncbi:MAG: hypothetical protein CMN34_05210 [Saprospirales bacterium]|nr:hypothetical protein [Saprospirales bacterium]